MRFPFYLTCRDARQKVQALCYAASLVGDRRASGDVRITLALMGLGLLDISLLNDLLHHILVVVGSELVFQGTVGRGVQDALGAMLVGHEYLPAADDLGEGDSLVALPLLDVLGAVDEDDEVILLALIVDFGLAGVSTRHDDESFRMRSVSWDWSSKQESSGLDWM